MYNSPEDTVAKGDLNVWRGNLIQLQSARHALSDLYFLNSEVKPSRRVDIAMDKVDW